jgi:hypothetical protein
MRFSFVIFVAFSLSVLVSPAFGCSCVQPAPGLNTAQQLAEWAVKGKDTIFEGKVESVELKWEFVEARTGDLVAADIEQDPPEMEVSFEVLRLYRGAQR